MPDAEKAPRRDGGVQSLHRALDLVEVVAARGGHLTIGEIAAATDVPLPTVHRLLRTLVDRGYMRQMPNRRYALGFRLVPLGATASSMVGADTEVVLGRLVDALGETANLAILSGSHAEYVAQVPSRHAMRMFTEVGRQVDLHSTGVGKALLASSPTAGSARSSVGSACSSRPSTPWRPRPPCWPTSPWCARAATPWTIRSRRPGVRCVAVPVGPEPMSWMAVSVSGPVTRMTDELIERAVPLLHEAGRQLTNRMQSSD